MGKGIILKIAGFVIGDDFTIIHYLKAIGLVKENLTFLFDQHKFRAGHWISSITTLWETLRQS